MAEERAPRSANNLGWPSAHHTVAHLNAISDQWRLPTNHMQGAHEQLRGRYHFCLQVEGAVEIICADPLET